MSGIRIDNKRKKRQAGELERNCMLIGNISTMILENILTQEELRLELKEKLRKSKNEDNHTYTKIEMRARLHWRDSTGTLKSIPIIEDTRLELKEKLRKGKNEENQTYKKLAIRATFKRRYDCNQKVCDFNSNSSSGLEYHMKKLHLDGVPPKFSCELCDFQSSKLMVKMHRGVEHKISLEKCGLCEFQSKWESSLYRHIRESHINRNSILCDLCSYRTSSSTTMLRHVESKHMGEECPVCGEPIRRRVMAQHIYSEHPNSGKDYYNKCGECGGLFLGKHQLNMHIKKSQVACLARQIVIRKCKNDHAEKENKTATMRNLVTELE